MKQPFRLPKVYPLTDTQISGLSHAEQVALFADGGATLVQLREKHMPAMQFYEEAKKALEVARARGVKLIINDRVDVAVALRGGADVGVHLGQDDYPVESARALLDSDAVIGYSTHSLDQVLEAVILPIDYVAIGPVFRSWTKKDTFPVVGLEGVEAARGVLGNKPLVAIGGITTANAKDVIDAGADSVAMISGLWINPVGISTGLNELLTSLSQ